MAIGWIENTENCSGVTSLASIAFSWSAVQAAAMGSGGLDANKRRGCRQRS